MKKCVLTFSVVFFSFNGMSQNKQTEKCALFNRLINDTLLTKEFFFDTISTNNFYIVDSSNFFNHCSGKVNDKTVKIVSSLKQISILNEHCIIELRKIEKSHDRYKIYIYYKPRHLWGFIEYKKKDGVFVNFKHRIGFF